MAETEEMKPEAEEKMEVEEEVIIEKSEKTRLPALLLCLFLGGLGIHRFYAGKVGTGVIWLLSGGLLGIGWLVDLIMIIVGSFTDKEEKVIEDWS